MIVKQGWQVANEDLMKIFNEIKDEAERLYPGITIPKSVYISNRMGGHTFGEYRYIIKSPRLGKLEFYEDGFLFSSLIYKINVKEIYNIIVHEIAHCVANKYFQRVVKHDIEWERVGNNIGKKFNQLVSQFVSDKETISLMKEKSLKPKYEVYCNHCHRIISKKKMCSIIKYPELWRCGVCGERLEKEKSFEKHSKFV